MIKLYFRFLLLRDSYVTTQVTGLKETKRPRVALEGVRENLRKVSSEVKKEDMIGWAI